MGTVYTEITIKNNTDFTLLKNGYKKEADVRSITTTAHVDTGADEILIGVIPLEEMDLIADPVNHKLVGAHGDNVVHLLVSIFGSN